MRVEAAPNECGRAGATGQIGYEFGMIESVCSERAGACEEFRTMISRMPHVVGYGGFIVIAGTQRGRAARNQQQDGPRGEVHFHLRIQRGRGGSVEERRSA